MMAGLLDDLHAAASRCYVCNLQTSEAEWVANIDIIDI